jgi:plasmid stabilization system protein ParE
MMSGFKVVRHPSVADDLDDIYVYIARVRQAPGTAIEFIAKIIGQFDRLDLAPGTTTPVHTRPPRPAYSARARKNYLIFYEVFPVDRVVRVLYVWHAARLPPDFERQDDPLPMSS